MRVVSAGPRRKSVQGDSMHVPRALVTLASATFFACSNATPAATAHGSDTPIPGRPGDVGGPGPGDAVLVLAMTTSKARLRSPGMPLRAIQGARSIARIRTLRRLIAWLRRPQI